MENCIDKIKCGELIVIGVRDYKGCLEPLSGLFINDEAGMGLKNAAATASGEYESGAAMLKKKIILATEYVINDFKKAVQPLFQFNGIIENSNKCEFSKGNLFFWPVANEQRGLKISRVEEPLAKIKVDRLIIRVKQSGNVELRIEDKNEVYKYQLVLSAGVNIVTLNKVFEDDDIYITMDNSALETSQGFCFNTCNGCAGSEHKDIIVQGWNGSRVDSYTYGMTVEAKLICDFNELFCSALDQLYFAIYHKSCQLVFNEMSKTNRLNPIANISKELAAEYAIAKGDEYKEEWKSVTKSLSRYLKSFKGQCIICKSNRYEISLP